MAGLSKPFDFILTGHWPGPLSLATTQGVSVDVLSYGYLDVSVPRVRLLEPMDSAQHTSNTPPTMILGTRPRMTIGGA
jgi:hypothetical protein